MSSFPGRPPTPDTQVHFGRSLSRADFSLWPGVWPAAGADFFPWCFLRLHPPVDPAPDLPLPPAPIVWGLLPEAPGWLCLLWCALLFRLLVSGREKIGVGFFFFCFVFNCFSDFVIWVVFLILGRWIDTGCRGLVLQFFFNNEKALGCRMKNKASENKCSS